MTLVASYTDTIEKALHDCLQEFRMPAELYAPVHYLFEGGGKRVRPVMCLLGCEVVGGNPQHAVSAAIAVELLHTFTLMHDDIMDRSPIRRGRPTVHVKYDENTAILSGDVMIGMAMRMLERSAEHTTSPLRVIKAFSTGLIEVCEGQSLDMTFMGRQDVTVDEYFEMIDKKTAKLLEMSTAIGALIGGCTDEHLQCVTTFARDIGIAFQMQDDVLDLLGSQAFGKTPGGDIVEGKRTWLVLQLRDRCADGAGRSAYGHLIDAFFANNGLPRERVGEMVAAMHAMGVIDDAERSIHTCTEKAFEHLHVLPASPARDALGTLARSLVTRTH